VALVSEESVSVVTVRTSPTPTGDPTMRIYIIGNDGITFCREPPATANEGEIAVATASVGEHLALATNGTSMVCHEHIFGE
jgi:hypothetical protein